MGEEGLANRFWNFAASSDLPRLGPLRVDMGHGEYAWVVVCIVSHAFGSGVDIPSCLLTACRAFYSERQDFEAQGANRALNMVSPV